MAKDKHSSYSLIDQAGVKESLELEPSAEESWIEVIHKMDSVYADLVHSQVELEQKNSELEETQQFVSSVLSAMTDVLIVCDTKSVILQVNTALLKLTGKTEQDYLQHSLSDIFSTDAQAMLDMFPQQLGNKSLIDCEVNVLCADGGSTPLAMNCSSRYDAHGVVIGMVLIGRPVGELRRAYEDLNRTHNELKRTQQQLLHSEKMASLGRLIAGVAHELNNPISFVFGNMHALKRYGLRIKEYLDLVHSRIKDPVLKNKHQELKIERIMTDMTPLIDGSLEGAERINNIVLDLRNYSGGQKEQYSLFELDEVIRKAVLWALKAKKNSPEIVFDFAAEKLMIESCKGQIHQVLVNLIQNALDAMEGIEYPRLILKYRLNNSQVDIQVIDSGTGIATQDVKNIFDPFYTSKPVGQGTGLGLYISYGIAQDLGGDLSYRENPQGGSVFTLSLPVQKGISS